MVLSLMSRFVVRAAISVVVFDIVCSFECAVSRRWVVTRVLRRLLPHHPAIALSHGVEYEVWKPLTSSIVHAAKPYLS